MYPAVLSFPVNHDKVGYLVACLLLTDIKSNLPGQEENLYYYLEQGTKCSQDGSEAMRLTRNLCPSTARVHKSMSVKGELYSQEQNKTAGGTHLESQPPGGQGR